MITDIRRRADGQFNVWALHPVTWEPAETPFARRWVVVGVTENFKAAVTVANRFNALPA